jgi:hypothetical protein
MLDDAQIDAFKRDGVLAVEGLIEPARLERWRERAWEVVGGRLDDPASWDTDTYQLDSILAEGPGFHDAPAVAEVAQQLGGGGFEGKDWTTLVLWPREGATWYPAHGGHVDPYGGPPEYYNPFVLTAVTYLYPVEHGGGAFTYWPGSHAAVWAFLREDPSRIDGSFKHALPEWRRHFTDLAPRPPEEFLAEPGTVLFSHSLVVHNMSQNVRDVPRFGMFTRWWHKEREALELEVPEDPFEHWGI